MDDLLRKLLPIFAEEVHEQIQKITAALLAMETDPATVPLHIEEVFRQAHSLKGSSASLQVTELEVLAHYLEEMLLPVRRSHAPLSSQQVEVGLRTMDAARLRIDGLLADGPQGAEAVAAATAALRSLATAPLAAAIPLRASDPAPESPVVAAPDEGEYLRVATSRLAMLERRVDELREVRGRLDQGAAMTSGLVRSLEQLWDTARAHDRERAARDGSPPSAPQSDTVYQILRQASVLRRALIDDAELAQANAADFADTLRELRMVAAAQLYDPLNRALRDACRRLDKEAHLELTGGDTQIDRRLLEELKHPLLHLVRNSVDHGIESLAVREAVGKPRATLTVAIERRGGDLFIEVRDDGRGVDKAAVLDQAVERGLVPAASASTLSETEVHALIFRPGFSTAEQVTALSGRGVGLDVVRNTVGRLHGRVECQSQEGLGTTFRLILPLTIAASESMLVEESGRCYALPQASLERIVRARADELAAISGRTFFYLQEQPIPVVRLARLLGLTEQYEGTATVTLAIVRGESSTTAVICERLLGGSDLVLRPLPPELKSIPLLDAVAVLPSGEVVFVLSPAALVQAAQGTRAPQVPDASSILVADDSITTRSLIRHTLETAGFRVRVAADGEQALRLALTEPFDLVVSDVQMPRVDGLELTARLRAHPRTAHTPVVLFSSLDSEEDRRRGALSGASAYLTKGAFDRGQLVDVIAGLLRGT